MAKDRKRFVKGKVLIIDDEAPQRIMLQKAVYSLGLDVTALEDPTTVVDRLRTEYHDVVISDMQMPQLNGLDLLQNIREADPTIAVIMLTAHGSIEAAVEAMKRGAEDFIQKPIELLDLDRVLKRVFEKRSLVRENLKLKSEVESLRRDIGLRYHLTTVMGSSPKAKELMQKIENASKSRDDILLLGEPGTDTEDAARMIHYNSPWGETPIVVYDCAYAPSDLHESHLFGIESSTKNGVRVPGQQGLFERAHMGTIVVANIHLLEKKSQSKLSRAVRNNECQRAGGNQTYFSDVRLLATSTPSDVKKLNEHRWDLYDFLMEKSITVPALNERPEDIPVLALAIARRLGREFGKNVDSLQKGFWEKLKSMTFPGNHRELESMMETALHRGDETILKIIPGKP